MGYQKTMQLLITEAKYGLIQVENEFLSMWLKDFQLDKGCAKNIRLNVVLCSSFWNNQLFSGIDFYKDSEMGQGNLGILGF